MRFTFTIVCFVLAPVTTLAQVLGQGTPRLELKKLTVEELMDVEVTSVSRSEQTFARAPAALAVLTPEDIRRSGATTVPDVLRLVPGVHVGRLTSSAWAVSSRGFSSPNSEKLLVLTDTRSLYTPLFSGELWDVQDYMLEDIARIEVIRGPGATLWGSNAVNGVINITTKSARDTQGLAVNLAGGNEEQVTIGARYGGRVGGGHYRVFGKFADRDGTFHPTLAERDAWDLGHAGARGDWSVAGGNTFTIQGDVYRGTIGQLAPSVILQGRPQPAGPLRATVGGGNVLARWRHSRSPRSDLQVRAYYDRTHRDDPMFVDRLHTVDLDVQNRIAVATRHEVTWGGNYRFTANTNTGKGVFALVPPTSHDHLVAGFVQDQMRVLDAVHVTVGTKLEHNDFSGGEVQPSARIAWDVSRRHFIWGAISRAVRVPTRLERDLNIDVTNPAAPVVQRLQGNPDFDAERLIAYEAGYRWQARNVLLVDVAAFHNRYEGLASLEVGTPFTDSARNQRVIPILHRNLTDGRATGFEATATFDPSPSWRLSASSSTLDMTLEPTGLDLNRGRFLDGATPRHQLGVRTSHDLPARLEFDAMFRHLTELRRQPLITTGERQPGYAELDLRLAWRRWRNVELSVIGRDLLHDQHREFGTPERYGEIERSVYAKVAWFY